MQTFSRTAIDAEDFIQRHFPVTHRLRREGGAFWGFLHQELIPLIESEYRADPGDRTLLGHSWGATFGLHPLRDPDEFHRYVIASSGPNFDDEANYAREHDRLPVRLHFVMEESESEVATLERFLDTLTSRRTRASRCRTNVELHPLRNRATRVPGRIGGSVLLIHGPSGSGSAAPASKLDAPLTVHTHSIALSPRLAGGSVSRFRRTSRFSRREYGAELLRPPSRSPGTCPSR